MVHRRPLTPAERAAIAYEALLREVAARDALPGLNWGCVPSAPAAPSPHETIVQARIAENVDAETDPSQLPDEAPEGSAGPQDANTGTVAEAPAPTEPALDPLSAAMKAAWLRRIFGR